MALKLFPVTPENADALSRRVLREGSLLAKINHRNVVVVHGVEQSNGFVGLWMEFIQGRTMEDELRTRGPLGAEEATLIGVDLCRALAAVHGRGLVHRDIKAQNVMREEGGRTVLMDFGAGTELTAGLRGLLDTAGTPLYLAPELFGGRPATRASDIYSLGVLLYRMVTREFPVLGADGSEIERASRGRVQRLRDARPIFQAALSRPSSARSHRIRRSGHRRPASSKPPDREKQDPPKPWPWLQMAAALVLVAVPALWFLSNRATAPENNQPSTATAVEPSSVTPSPAVVKPSYTVKAVLLRSRNDVETPITAGTPLAAGDQLAMRIEASTEVHVYVLNADDTGKAFRLYPLQNGLTNPLSPSTPHRLPDATQNWVVTSEGGREHFMVMVSPTRDEAADAVFRGIPR